MKYKVIINDKYVEYVEAETPSKAYDKVNIEWRNSIFMAEISEVKEEL